MVNQLIGNAAPNGGYFAASQRRLSARPTAGGGRPGEPDPLTALPLDVA